MRPTWVLSSPGGPHEGPINVAIRGSFWCNQNVYRSVRGVPVEHAHIHVITKHVALSCITVIEYLNTKIVWHGSYIELCPEIATGTQNVDISTHQGRAPGAINPWRDENVRKSVKRDVSKTCLSNRGVVMWNDILKCDIKIKVNIFFVGIFCARYWKVCCNWQNNIIQSLKCTDCLHAQKSTTWTCVFFLCIILCWLP